MNLEEKLLKVIKRPYISEKTTNLGAANQYSFRVASCADKITIKKAIEMLFNVVVTDVRVINVKPKAKHFGRQNEGWRKAWKKAYVTLKNGDVINFDTLPAGETK